jgi:uncharacterized membrane protein YwaF
MAFNEVAGTNYGYLNRKPSVGTMLDLFGPWPGYVVVEIAVVAGVWALMTWPWVRARRHDDEQPGSELEPSARSETSR